MEKKIALLDILTAIDTLSAGVDKKFEIFDKKFDGITQRLGRLEITVNEIQKNVEGLQDEMRGIHKVLDRFDWRITRLEKHLGLEIKGSAG